MSSEQELLDIVQYLADELGGIIPNNYPSLDLFYLYSRTSKIRKDEAEVQKRLANAGARNGRKRYTLTNE